MYTIAQVGPRVEASVAVGDDDGRLGAVHAARPLGDTRVELLDALVAEGEGNDEVDLRRVSMRFGTGMGYGLR